MERLFFADLISAVAQRSPKILAAFTLGLLAISAPANAAGTSGSFLINKIVVENGRFMLFGTGISNPDACSTSAYVIVGSGVPKQDYFLSVALTAKSTGKPVSVWMDGCAASNWDTSAPVAVSIILE